MTNKCRDYCPTENSFEIRKTVSRNAQSGSRSLLQEMALGALYLVSLP